MLKKLVPVFFFGLLSLLVVLPSFAAVPYPEDPPIDPPEIEGLTSLETWVIVSGETPDSVMGTVSMQNVGEHPGVISEIRIVVEARRGKQWVEVGSCDLLDTTSYLELPVADTETLSFECSFAADPLDKSYRAVSHVVLDNHPKGTREFIYRESF